MAGVLPGKPLVPELDFSSQPYGNLSKRFDIDAAEARSVIEEKLPVLAQLNALVSVAFGTNPPLFVDARAPGSPAKLLDTPPEDGAEPDSQVTIQPASIIQFAQGHLEPRFGLFKDAYLYDTAMRKETIPLAIKFADLLTPQGPPAEAKLPVPGVLEQLPVPTEDIAQVKRDIKQFGYGFVKNALTPTQVAVLRKAVEEQAAGERKAGIARMDSGPDAGSGPNQRLWVLTNKGDEFLDLLNHPLIDEIVPWLIGDHALLHAYAANIARPGNIPMQMHTDQVAIQPPIRDLVFGVNIMFCLTDMHASNGATRVIPGSHLGHVAPADIFSTEGTIAAEAPAGTAFIFESRIWHGTGANTLTPGSPDSERPAILMFFMRSFIRSQENYPLSLRPDVAPKLSKRQRKFLGFCATGAVGGQDGDIREGVYFDRREDCPGAIRAPHEPYMPKYTNGV
ncbi:PhyH-domain-containing protein [Annulohypoxylon truncatum]|uniref:PhyH-domain-containing protein n=1 Tax=Annulohypoxylon truncatum TaxID=327061 RepID=UPI002007CE8F|nr:PhyH-domain-containing protein [Annulohypoxylon truncatum]KAI1210756.1 PhyH-domain-containing protein [Annulohypoxylon truncatum]